MNNLIQVDRAEFRSAMKLFTPKRAVLGPALLAFEGGFLSIESGSATAVMRASGHWNGRAIFSPEVLRALATYPPKDNPITISYADSSLLIAGLTIKCQWQSASKALVAELTHPGILDLLALERTLPRVEVKATSLAGKIRSARDKAERRIKKAADQLAELDITEEQIRELVEARIRSRISSADHAN